MIEQPIHSHIVVGDGQRYVGGERVMGVGGEVFASHQLNGERVARKFSSIHIWTSPPLPNKTKNAENAKAG